MMCQNGGKFERFKKNLCTIFSAKAPLSNMHFQLKKKKLIGFGRFQGVLLIGS